MFPVTHREGEPEEWGLSAAYIDELSGIFQGVDVNAESRKALGWVRANVGRKKSARGMKKFLFGWMERTQGHGTRLAGMSGPNGDDAARRQVSEQRRAEIAMRVIQGKS